MIKGKSVEPFTCLQHQGRIVTDRSQIDTLLQHSWNPIFAKYPNGETKANDYHTLFSLSPGTYPQYSLPPLTLDDMHYVLRKKLKNNTATGLDGWRPHELKNLPDCLLLALLDIFHLCEKVGRFPSSFYYSYTTLIPKGVARTPLSLRPITVLPVPYRLYVVYVGKHCSIGKILGYILHSLLSVKDVVLLVSTVTFLLICCRDIRHMAASLASSLTLLSVLILSLIPLFGLPLNIMVAIPLLLTFFLIYIQISHAVSVMQDVSAPFGTLPTGYYKEILFVLLFLTVSSALWLLACQPWET